MKSVSKEKMWFLIFHHLFPTSKNMKLKVVPHNWICVLCYVPAFRMALRSWKNKYGSIQASCEVCFLFVCTEAISRMYQKKFGRRTTHIIMRPEIKFSYQHSVYIPRHYHILRTVTIFPISFLFDLRIHNVWRCVQFRTLRDYVHDEIHNWMKLKNIGIYYHLLKNPRCCRLVI
jgi:hypothetical protein